MNINDINIYDNDNSSFKGDSILQHLYDDYVFNNTFNDCNEIIRKIPALIENHLAIKIGGTVSPYSTDVNVEFLCACKFICKHNKKNKSGISKNDINADYHIRDRKYADDNVTANKLKKYKLNDGIYVAEFNNGNYALLKIELNDSGRPYPYIRVWSLYFIGKKFSKYKNKYFEMVDKYKDIRQEIVTEQIVYDCDERKSPKDTIFKSFDQMVIRDKNKLLSYVDNWVDKIPIYYKKGIPCKLSIIIYGKPGTGKSTFCKALAKRLGIKQVCVMSPQFFRNDDAGIETWREAEPKLFAIDDIDCICSSRENDDNKIRNDSVLSSLLEFLDNPPTYYYKAKDGVYYPISIVVATTNYYDKLDPAVKRYGRFDLHIEMEEFNKQEAEEMCNIYGLDISDVIDIETAGDSFTISPAYLQALCIEKIDNSLKTNDIDSF